MKKKDPPPPPVPRLQDMSVSDIAKLNVEAYEKGDASKLLEILKGSIESEPPVDPPARYAIHLPVLLRDGDGVVGLQLRMLYAGQGPQVAIETPEGIAFTVSLTRLGAVVDALRAAMYASPHPTTRSPGAR